jgi:hypothetical protein
MVEEDKFENLGMVLPTFGSRGGPKRISQTLALRSHRGHDEGIPPSLLPQNYPSHDLPFKNCSKHIVIESVTIVVSCYSSRDNSLRASHQHLHNVFWMKNNQVYANLG